VLTRLIEARRSASTLRAAILAANEAANRAVLATSEDESAKAARESFAAAHDADEIVGQLEPLLESLGYRTELDSLGRIKSLWAEYKQLDSEVLGLAVENTNLKAQRLSFGDGQEAATAFGNALDAMTDGAAPAARLDAERARNAVLRIQVLQTRHIAESRDTEMTRLEQQMHAAADDARGAVDALQRTVDRTAATARDALNRFMSVNEQIVQLSRRNSNVRSLELTFGRKRIVAARLQDEMRVLEGSLAQHGSEATR
jgi:hypothetical protein